MGKLSDRARNSIRKVGRFAAFTIVQDEPEMLPIWKAYYGPHCDLYVLDHDSVPPVEGGIPVHHKWSWDYVWYHDIVQQFQEALFEAGYEVVIFVTPDEIIQPVGKSLTDYLTHLEAPVTRVTTYDVVDMGQSLDDINDDGVIVRGWKEPLDQPIDFACATPWVWRRWMVRRASYDKPLIVRKPYIWHFGFHSGHIPGQPAEESQVVADPRLLMYHLHRIDYKNAKVRHARKRLRLNHTDITQFGRGDHNLLVEEPDFYNWFYGDRTQKQRTPWSLDQAEHGRSQ